MAAVETFQAALEAIDVGWTRTTPDAVGSVLREVCVNPTVGAPLPFDDAALPSWVETDPTPADLEEASTGATAATFAVADYGSVVLESTPGGVEPASLFPDRHVAVVRAADVVGGMDEAFERLGPRLRQGASAVLATGPSATADMGDLVVGAHGPTVVHVVILDA